LLGKDFSKATKKDIEKIVESINEMKYHGKPISDWTKYTYQVVLKRFYKWLLGNNEEYPIQVKWIHPRMEKGHDIAEGRLLKIDDVKKMAEVAENQRDRAFVLFLYESGARIGEVMSIHVKDFTTDQYGAIVHIPEGKTGPRDIRIIASAPAISTWLTQHPAREDNESLLFCGISNYKRGQNVVYQNYRKILLKLAERAKIKKDVNPHFFRHSRASDLAKKVKSPAILCQYMGWKQGSKEAATYVHIDSTDNEILAINGIQREEQKQENFKPIKCPRCNIVNDPASKFCRGCSLLLDEKSIGNFEKDKETATQLGFDLQTIMNNKDLMLKIMNMFAEEWEKTQRKK
jgi:integrase